MTGVRRGGYIAGLAPALRLGLHDAYPCRPDHFRAQGQCANGDATVTRALLKDDGTVVEILRDGSERPLVPQVDWARIDATTEEDIAAQIAEDEAEARRDAAAYARRVRRKAGLS
jgi:hypothetical protein